MRDTSRKGDLWVVVPFFNAGGFQTPMLNYHAFVQRLDQQGVKCLTVELAFENRPFVLDDRPHLYRLRSQSVLWAKERLINHALSLLPVTCDKVAWIDADILWPDASWAERTADALERHFDLVQLFDGVFRLYPGQSTWTEVSPEGHPLWWEPGTVFHAVNCMPWEKTAMGFAWAARRAWLEKIGGLYDRAILGGGDALLLNVALEHQQTTYDNHITAWQDGVRRYRPRVGYVAGTICHLFHGNLRNRGYDTRHQILLDNHFDPRVDVFPVNNVLEWATHKPKLHMAVKEYFLSRQEDAQTRVDEP